MAAQNRMLFWTIIGLGLLALAIWAFTPRAVDVDMVEVRRAPMTVSVREEGETRIHDVFSISAPVSGTLERISLEAGDCVYQGETVVAVIRSAPAPILDTRTRDQLEAAAEAAGSAVVAASAELDRVRAELDRAEADANRYRALQPEGAVSLQRLEQAEAAEATLQAAERAAEAALAMRRQELAAARAALRPSSEEGDGELVDVMAPIDGVLLKRLRQSEGPVAQGAPLIEVGDPEEIEIVADLLSEDAVQISKGDRVVISDWGGPDLLGRVRLVEPFAFTKVSALGIEEQRVNVVIDLSPGQVIDRLGHGYRVDVAVEVWSAEDVLVAPMTALFKQDRIWSVYRIENGRARLRPVDVGQMNGQVAQVLAGLEADDRLVEHPSSRIADRVKVRPRPATKPSQVPDDDGPGMIGTTASLERMSDPCAYLVR